jgi:hypothetical protein
MSQYPCHQEEVVFAEDEYPLANLSSRIIIPKAGGNIYIIKPESIVSLRAGESTSTIFRRPEGYDRFVEDFRQLGIKEALIRMERGDYTPSGRTNPQSLVGFWASSYPEKSNPNGALYTHPPWLDLEAEDDAHNKLVLAGSKEAYLLVANAWRPGRSWFDILTAAGAVPK